MAKLLREREPNKPSKPTWAEVVAHLVERLLPTPKICGSNPDKILSANCTLEKTKIKKKRPILKNLQAHKSSHRLFEVFKEKQ